MCVPFMYVIVYICQFINSHNSPTRQVTLLSPFCKWRNQGSERLKSLPGVTQLTSSTVGLVPRSPRPSGSESVSAPTLNCLQMCGSITKPGHSGLLSVIRVFMDLACSHRFNAISLSTTKMRIFTLTYHIYLFCSRSTSLVPTANFHSTQLLVINSGTLEFGTLGSFSSCSVSSQMPFRLFS